MTGTHPDRSVVVFNGKRKTELMRSGRDVRDGISTGSEQSGC